MFLRKTTIRRPLTHALLLLTTLGLSIGEAAAPKSKTILWRDPGDVSKLDFSSALDFAVNPPAGPFQFDHEDLSGTSTKIYVRDAKGTMWNVKFGAEVKPESFCWRIVRACGYLVEPSFFVAEGKIEKLGKLARPSTKLKEDGRFLDARFQWRTDDYSFVKNGAWLWDRNPFAGTPELNGLKILLMLMSNFDNKDARVGARGGPNTGVFLLKDGTQWFTFTDWGSAMGRWGDHGGQTAWRCDDMKSQSREFVRGVEAKDVLFGFEGHAPHFNDNIRISDVAWLMRTLGRITNDQLRAGLRVSGANAQEQECFTQALRTRIEALRRVAGAL